MSYQNLKPGMIFVHSIFFNSRGTHDWSFGMFMIIKRDNFYEMETWVAYSFKTKRNFNLYTLTILDGFKNIEEYYNGENNEFSISF